MILVTEVKEWGNSFGVHIPKAEAKKLNITKGDKITMKITKKSYDIDEVFGTYKGTGPFVRERNDRF